MFGDQSMLRVRCCLPRAIPEEFLDYPAEGGCSHQGASAITFRCAVCVIMPSSKVALR